MSLFKSAFIIGIFSLLSRILGLYRDRLLSTTFGAFDAAGIYDLDTYFAAFRIPDFVFNLLVLGTVSSAFIPIFSEYIHKKSIQEAWKYVNSLLNLLIFILTAILIILFIFAPYVVALITPGFIGEKLNLTVQLTRLMLISPLIFTISSVFQGVQNAFHRFFYYSLAPVLYNIGIITGVIFFSHTDGVFAAAYGVIVGALMHLAIQIFPVISLGYKYRLQFDYQRKDIIDSFRLMIPRIIGQSGTQLSLIIDTIIASLLPTGTLTILIFALNINSLPIGVIGISLSVASFSIFSQLASQKDMNAFSNELRRSIYSIISLLIPASIGLYLLRDVISSLILRGGKFQDDEVLLTASVLGIYAFGIVFQSLIPLFARAFYALKNTRIPTIVSVSAILLNISLSIICAIILKFGIYGLAMANVLASIFNALILGFLLRKKMHAHIIDPLELVSIICAASIMAIGTLMLKSYILTATQLWQQIILTALVILLSSGIYFILMKLLHRKSKT